MLGRPCVGMMGGDSPGLSFRSYDHGMASEPRCVGYGLGNWWVGCASGQLYSSPSGFSGTWTLVTTFSSFVPARIDFYAGRLLIVATDQVKWSTNGSSFSSYTYTSIGTAQDVSSCYGGGYYIVTFGNSSNGKYLWTADFTTWTVTTSASGVDIAGMVWDGTKFLVARRNTAELRTFTNPALTTLWATQGVAPTSFSRVVTFMALGSRLILLGFVSGGASIRAWSDDGGATWTNIASITPSWVDGAAGAGKTLMFRNPSGTDTQFYRSDNGSANAVLIVSVTSETFKDVVFGNGRFTAVSSLKIYIDR